MAAIRYSIQRSVRSFTNPSSKVQLFRSYACYAVVPKLAEETDGRPSFASVNRNYEVNLSRFSENRFQSGFGTTGFESLRVNRFEKAGFVPKSSAVLSNLCFGRNGCSIGFGSLVGFRKYSSSSGAKGGDVGGGPVVPAASGGDPAAIGGGETGSGSDLVKVAKEAWSSAVDALTYSCEKTKEVSSELTPYVHQFLDSHPYLRDIIVPVGFTLSGTMLAWFVMPKILRRFHNYAATQGPAALLSTNLFGPVPYEKSFWGALEDPMRYLITFMAFSQIGAMVAPTTFAVQYITPAWRGAVIISFVWFLHRWKTNVFARALGATTLGGSERAKLLTLDKISSVGLFSLGLMAIAEACGVAVQSILTVGGIGGVATAFAAKDIFGNVLSGLSVQVSQPFSLGDTIKVGSMEGQVVEMGLTTTSLLSAEKFPIIVPNSLFSSQAIVNKSRAGWRAIVTTIPFQNDDIGKVPLITDDIKNMLKSNPKIFLEKEPPYCYLSRIERSYSVLTLGCNLKQMSKNAFYSAQQEILLQSVDIIKKHGASLGSTVDDTTSL